MGIFNKNIFNELSDDLKKIKEKLTGNTDDTEKEEDKGSPKCPNCGASIKETDYNCDYCGASIKETDYNCDYCGVSLKNNVAEEKKETKSNYEIKKYPVLVEFNSNTNNKFVAYDAQTDINSERHDTVESALEDLRKELQDVVDEGEGFEFWTEEQLQRRLYVRSQLRNGAKIKYVELRYINPENDPDW